MSVAAHTWSLRARLTALAGGAVFVLWTAAGTWIYQVSITESNTRLDNALVSTAHAVLSVLRNKAAELAELHPGESYEIAPSAAFDVSDIDYQVRGPNGRLIFRSPGSPSTWFADWHARDFQLTTIGNQEYRVYTLSTEMELVTIHVAQPTAARNRIARDDALRLLLPGILLTLAIVLAIAAIVRSTMQPVMRYARELDELSPQSESAPVDTALPAELFPVTRAIQGLLARSRDALLRERTLTADAAHELRTPLAVLRIHAQIAERSRDDQERQRALRNLRSATDRLSSTVDAVLALARLDARTLTPAELERVALDRLAHLVAREFEPLAATQGLLLQVTGPGVRARGDQDALAIAMRNLISNALRHARSKVVLCIGAKTDGEAFVRVTDDGPGFSEESRQRAFHRFYRKDSEDSAHVGAGLGLAMVLRVAELHGGSATIIEGIDGGGGVEMTLGRQEAVTVGVATPT